MFFFTGVYESVADAERDYDAIKKLHDDGEIGSYDAAVLSKDGSGEVKVHKDEKPTKHAGWVGAAAGAGVAILFPATIAIAVAGGGAGVGAWFGHMAHGMKRHEAESMATMLEAGRAGPLGGGGGGAGGEGGGGTRGPVSPKTEDPQGAGRAGLVVVGVDESAAKVEEVTSGSISHMTKHLEGSSFEDAEAQARWAFERQEQPTGAL